MSERLVITAAHCVWDLAAERLYNIRHFRIAAGKYLRTWRTSDDVNGPAQEFSVSAIRVPLGYNDRADNYNADLALLVLNGWIRFGIAVRPICVDLNLRYNERHKTGTHGRAVGRVAGWGLQASAGQPSEVLRVLQVPLVAADECASSVPPKFRRYVTTDKFCAGFLRRNVSLCVGDSGGGLVTPKGQFGSGAMAVEADEEEVFYLQGIVSSGDSENMSCNSNSYTVFTNVHYYQEFIREVMSELAGGVV